MKDLEYELEDMIDRRGISTVIEALSEICSGKEQHVLDEYGDKPLAKFWSRAQFHIDKAGAAIDVDRLKAGLQKIV